jgi:hypothetical protein
MLHRKSKVFLDTVHGYISVPDIYCDYFIDTLLFQRLRRIEQTSMRSLYPSARHDRFIHSLGTFHLGSKIFQAIYQNSSSELPEFSDALWDKMQETFEIACLLHDCGHAPFSHTFEKYFDRPACLSDKLIQASKNKQFKYDIESQADAAEHEKVSAYLVFTYFLEKLKLLKVDPILVVRMIIGCLYEVEKTPKEKLANCFISLLKGKIIDVDRLDYVTRDKWACGFSSNNVSIERLLSAACIKKKDDKYYNCFYKNALSEIQNVIDVINFQHIWIFSHHKVVYDQYILEKAIEKLSTQLSGTSDKEKSLNKLFNIESFFGTTKIGTHSIYLPTDDDLVHYQKIYLDNNSYAKEWLSRNHKLKPIWKTFAEFNTFFSHLSPSMLEEGGNLEKQSTKIIQIFLSSHNENKENYLRLGVKPKFKVIGANEVFIAINDNIVDYDTLKLPQKTNNLTRFFFYIFIPSHLIQFSNELIDSLKEIK